MGKMNFSAGSNVKVSNANTFQPVTPTVKLKIKKPWTRDQILLSLNLGGTLLVALKIFGYLAFLGV